MKKGLTAAIVFIAFLVIAGVIVLPKLITGEDPDGALKVYCYDSFAGDWGAGEELARRYEEQTGIPVQLIPCGGANEMYSQILYEGKNCEADLVVGLSDMTGIDKNLFLTYSPLCSDDLVEKPDSGVSCFDYGIFAFIENKALMEKLGLASPTCLADLAKPEYKGQVILVDPRTSSVGTGLLIWTIEAMGKENAMQWWKAMKDNAMTIADSWSSAYGLFTEGEAPLVISYSTSPAYHAMNEGSDNFRALEFTDGHIATYEYLGIPETSGNRYTARDFAEFILTDGQQQIALANTMLPSNSKTELPAEFENASLKPSKMISYNRDLTSQALDGYLDEWVKAMVQ